MMKKHILILFQLAFLVYVSSSKLKAQTINESNLFKPLEYRSAPSMYRSSGGYPAQIYWQNHADYFINVNLDTTANQIKGTVQIDYTNNSPEDLDYLWLQLDQNNKKKDSRYTVASFYAMKLFDSGLFTSGYYIDKVQIEKGANLIDADYLINDTRMQIRLHSPLRSKGGRIIIRIHYSFTIPGKESYRMGCIKTKNGLIYQVGQWFPRMAVYDDISGWNINPYLIQSEFYLDYGNYDYFITVPGNMIVAGSGDLLNAKDVLSAMQLKRLQLAKHSDSAIIIHNLKDASAVKKNNKTWHFQCLNCRDVAWAASAAFIWDAIKIDLPLNKQILAMSFYPIESKNSWQAASEYTRQAVKFFSSKLLSYPLANAVNVAGGVPGMEYPGIVFCDWKADAVGLLSVTAHEFGHNWFPMIVGSNERKYAWMDEGMTEFMQKWFLEEYRIKHSDDDEVIRTDSLSSLDIKRLFTPNRASIMSWPMIAGPDELPCMLLKILREVVLGEQRFDYALKMYALKWAYKHPSPFDFFRAIDNAAGEDLSWFWREWFFSDWMLDQAVGKIEYIHASDFSKGAKITIVNKNRMVMPVTIEITEEGNSIRRINLPVEVWVYGGEYTFWYGCKNKIIRIQIDPDKRLPDINRINNVWNN